MHTRNEIHGPYNTRGAHITDAWCRCRSTVSHVSVSTTDESDGLTDVQKRRSVKPYMAISQLVFSVEKSLIVRETRDTTEGSTV